MLSLKERKFSKTDLGELQPRQAAPEVVIGRLMGFEEDGTPLVSHPDNGDCEPLAAMSTAVLDANAIGRPVALLFADGDPNRPLIIGLVRKPQAVPHQDADPVTLDAAPDDEDPAEPLDAVIDGDRIQLTAAREIVLKCGKASIHLTRAGKILIRGAFLLSRSSGANRIKGASVQIN